MIAFMDIGSRIEQARTRAGLDRNQLAAACGISYQAVQQWEVGKTKPAARALLAIAKATGTNPDWLVDGTGKMDAHQVMEPDKTYSSNVESAPWPLGHVPLISSIQAGAWCEAVDNFHPGDAEEWLPAPAKHGPHAYALRVMGTSMEPRLKEGELVVVDPGRDPESGSIVVAKKAGNQEVTLKQIIREGGETYLKALNPHWPEPIIRMTEEWSVCGRVICKIEIF